MIKIKNNIALVILIMIISSCTVRYPQENIKNKYPQEAGYPVSIANYTPTYRLRSKVKRAYEFTYLTKDENSLVKASSLILIPKQAKNKIVVYAHPTTGVSPNCGMDNGLYQYVLANHIKNLLNEHYIVVLPNYRGLGISNTKHKYLNAQEAAFDILDATKAAIILLKKQEDIPIILWGYSQGGQATQRASEIASFYAPNLNIKGSIQNAAPLILSDLWEKFKSHDLNMFQYMVIPYMINGLERSRPNLDTSYYIDSNKVENYCSLGLITLLPMIYKIKYNKVNIKEEDSKIALDYLKEQDAPKYYTNIPILILRGKKDEIIPKEIYQKSLLKLCEKGIKVQEIIRKGGHINLSDWKIAIKWIESRFNDFNDFNDFKNSCDYIDNTNTK